MRLFYYPQCFENPFLFLALMLASLKALRSSLSETLTAAGLAPSTLPPGQLSCQAFVVAGEWLVGAASGWQWAGSPTPAARSSLLPCAQQYLTTAVHAHAPACCSPPLPSGSPAAAEGFECLEQRQAAAASPSAPAPAATVVTLCLVYDHWWRTPRLYLACDTLSPAELLATCCAAEQGGVTATLEEHPFGAGLCVSLHPCQHARVMAALLHTKPPHLYLALLLKVLANAMPRLPVDTLCV
jgi:hypothetical protein